MQHTILYFLNNNNLIKTISKNVGNISGEALYKYDILVSDGNDYLIAEVSQDNKVNAVTKVYDKVVLEVKEFVAESNLDFLVLEVQLMVFCSKC